MRFGPWYALIISLASCSGSNSGDDVRGGSREGGSNQGGRGGTGTTSRGGAGGGPDFGSPPAEVSSILLPQINPAWPLGDWDGGIYGPQIILDCNTGQRAYTQIYDVTITAGAGLDFSAKTRDLSGVSIPDWTGTLSEDRQALLVPSDTHDSTLNGIAVTTVHSPLTFKLVYASSSKLEARLYFGATLTGGGETCKYQLKDYTLSNTDKRLSDVVQGTSPATLDPPVKMKRWASFPIGGAGLGRAEASYRHAVKPVLESGSLPGGLVLDPTGWAIKVSDNAIWFYVMVGITNQGSTPVCLYESEIGGVENAANIPVHKSVSTKYAAPSIERLSGGIPCFRPNDRGWIIGSVSVATDDSSAFTNAAVVKIRAPMETSLFPDDPAPTPYKARYSPGEGLHVDVIDYAREARVVYLDSAGLPVGTDDSHDSLPSEKSSLNHMVYTFSFPEPEILGTAATAVVYTISD